MKVRLTFFSRIEDFENELKFILHPNIEVISEVQAKTLLTLVAEVGGYLGLTLGVSLLDLKLLLSYVGGFIRGNQKHF